MAERTHLSIGEVLNLLQTEFPDVTISKIRFLESQGLIDPERTESGYRKFQDRDISQLRWILHQQRDNFLPLKVIKQRIESGDLEFDESDAESGDVPDPDAGVQLQLDADSDAEPVAEPRPRGATKRRSSKVDLGASSLSMSLDDLAEASGLTPHEVSELQRYNLLESQRLGDIEVFDERALVVCKLAVAFGSWGVEPRHLRAYKASVQREAGLYEQALLPLLKQRDPESRADGQQQLQALIALGDELRAALLQQVLKDHLPPG
jgi:DNA-binding transcriptional MerR regulator